MLLNPDWEGESALRKRYSAIRLRLANPLGFITQKPEPVEPPSEVDLLRAEVRQLRQELNWLRQERGEGLLIEDCMRVVALYYGVSRNDLISHRRDHSVVRPRQIAMYVARKLTKHSSPEIGRRIGDRDHTTVLHAIRKVGDLIASDEKFRKDVDAIMEALGRVA